jgi:hypothetical protein
MTNFAEAVAGNGHKDLNIDSHTHGALRHSHENGTRLHTHGIEEIGHEAVSRSHGTTEQLDRIEAELNRLHHRLDDFEALAMKFVNGGGAKYLALFAKVAGK